MLETPRRVPAQNGLKSFQIFKLTLSNLQACALEIFQISYLHVTLSYAEDVNVCKHENLKCGEVSA